MASFYGVNAQVREVQGRMVNPPDGFARRMVMYDEYTLLADLAVNDVIQLMRIPKGARVIGGALKYGAGGGTAALNLGWAASADGVETAAATGFFSAQSIVSAGATTLAAASVGFFKKFDAEVQVRAVATAVTSGATGIKIALALDVAIA